MNALCNYCSADLGEEMPLSAACEDCSETLNNFSRDHGLTSRELGESPTDVLKAILAIQGRHLEHTRFLTDLHKHIVKCARRDTNIEHYPAEWAPLKKRLVEIVGEL